MVLLCFEGAEKGKVIAFKGTPALMRGEEIRISVRRNLAAIKGVWLKFSRLPESYSTASSAGS